MPCGRAAGRMKESEEPDGEESRDSPCASPHRPVIGSRLSPCATSEDRGDAASSVFLHDKEPSHTSEHPYQVATLVLELLNGVTRHIKARTKLWLEERVMLLLFGDKHQLGFDVLDVLEVI